MDFSIWSWGICKPSVQIFLANCLEKFRQFHLKPVWIKLFRNLHLPASLRLCQAQKSHRHARPQNLSLVTNPLPIREQIPCSQIRKILQMTKWSLETVHLVQIYKFFLLLLSSGKNYYFDTVHFSDRDLENRALFSIPEVILAFTWVTCCFEWCGCAACVQLQNRAIYSNEHLNSSKSDNGQSVNLSHGKTGFVPRVPKNISFIYWAGYM